MKKILGLFLLVFAIGFTSCTKEEVTTEVTTQQLDQKKFKFNENSILTLDQQIILFHYPNKVSLQEFVENNSELSKDTKQLLLSQRGSGDTEVICDNAAGWIVVNNETGLMMLYEYDNSPTGIIANPCDWDCWDDHCWGGMNKVPCQQGVVWHDVDCYTVTICPQGETYTYEHCTSWEWQGEYYVPVETDPSIGQKSGCQTGDVIVHIATDLDCAWVTFCINGQATTYYTCDLSVYLPNPDKPIHRSLGNSSKSSTGVTVIDVTEHANGCKTVIVRTEDGLYKAIKVCPQQ